MLKFLVISGPGSDYHIGYLILDTSFGQRGAISPEAFVIISRPSCVVPSVMVMFCHSSP